MKRRTFLQHTLLGVAGTGLTQADAAKPAFQLNYLVGSAMYGDLPLATVIEETPKTGATHLDVWPRKHGTQREQMDEMGHEKVMELLAKHGVKLASTTRYDLGPFKLDDEIPIVKKFGGKAIVTGASGGKSGITGDELKKVLTGFVEKLKPTLAKAGEAGLTIVIENHGNGLMESPDSVRWLADLGRDLPLGIELAPYHLPQDTALLSDLIKHLDKKLSVFLAWQFGMGCMKPMPKEEELQQMPGRGKLDFTPLLKALKDINYSGFTQIFMHPTPRGIPILPTAPEVTAEINRSKAYLEKCLASI
jgi:sugar phosphate isomerase/epimerase